MQDLKGSIDQLAELMTEFQLSEGEVSGLDWRVVFRRQSRPQVAVQTSEVSTIVTHDEEFESEVGATSAPEQNFTPIISPMSGVYYNAPSPNSRPFVQEGDKVIVGQTIALIESMKLFNEVPATVAGTVKKIAGVNAQVLNQGDPILFVETHES